MKPEFRWDFVVVGFLLALGVFAGAAKLSGSIDRTRRTTISVKGFAEKPIRSNSAKWEIHMTQTAKTLPAGVAALEHDRELIVQFLHRHGVKDPAITLGGVTSRSFNKKNDKGVELNAIEGYTFEQTVVISSDNVDQIAQLERDSAELLKNGVQMSTSAPQYFYNQMDSIKTELLAAAAKDAKLRAVALATNSGNRVGPLVDGQQGVFQITAPNSTDTSGGGAYDVSTIDKVVKAVVTMAYVIE